MLQFANAKINLGLHVTRKRSDGYHDIETIFYPVKLYDALEILPADRLVLTVHSDHLAPADDNLCMKAYQLLTRYHNIPAVHIHLLKHIPIGAGLGGGSSDAAYVLKMLNSLFNLLIAEEQLMSYASELGADCPFFIRNTPVFATGIGTDLEDIQLDLSRYYIIIIKPKVFISTAEAYRGIVPMPARVDLRTAVKLPIQEWKYHIVNDFELGFFKTHPEIQSIKAELYELGALYASMSGSGSALFGIFEELPDRAKLEHLGEVYFPINL